MEIKDKLIEIRRGESNKRRKNPKLIMDYLNRRLNEVCEQTWAGGGAKYESELI